MHLYVKTTRELRGSLHFERPIKECDGRSWRWHTSWEVLDWMTKHRFLTPGSLCATKPREEEGYRLLLTPAPIEKQLIEKPRSGCRENIEAT